MTIKWNDRRAKAIVLAAGLKAAHDVGEKLLTLSIAQAPHADGQMQQSADVTDSPKERRVYVSYDTPYAVKQHEDLSLRHPDPTNPKSEPGRKAKFLEDPLNENRKEWAAEITAAQVLALRKGR